MISRRTLMQNLMQNAIISIAVCAHSMPARAQKTSKTALLPSPSDLRQVAVQAGTRGEPLVLMVSLPGCPWCELLRRNYLMPMRAEGVAAFEFMINERSQRIADFKGQPITPAAFSEALKINITPTLLLFNAQGQEIAPRIEGVASADFIGAILDERLATARDRLKTTR
jgi:thioredoxin-related protein